MGQKTYKIYGRGVSLLFSPFMAELRKGKAEGCHVFLMAGEESYFIDKAREWILSMLFPDAAGRQDGLEKLQGAVDTDKVIRLLENAPFLTDKNVVFWQDPPFLAVKKTDGEKPEKKTKDKKQARWLDYLQNLPPYSYLILQAAHKPDKRKKIYKTLEQYGMVLEAEPIRAWNIGEWLQGKLQSMHRDMDRGARAYFARAVSVMDKIDLTYLDTELSKLPLYSDRQRYTQQDLETVFSSLPEVSSFALLDAVSERNGRRALMLLRRQFEDGTYFTRILALLVRHVRQLWQAKVLMGQGIRGRALAKPMSLNPYIAEKVGQAAAAFPESVLERGMLELIDADYLLKTGQAGNERLEHAIITLCGGA